MSYRFTLAEARVNGSLQDVAGVCADSAQFVGLLNEVQERLLRRGGWYDTEQLVRFCLTGCYITWPRCVGTVLGLRSCRTGQAWMQNKWYQIMGVHEAGYRYGPNGNFSFGSELVAEDANPGPAHNDITGSEGKLIRYYVVKRNDVGKTITLYGKQFGGQPLQEKVNGQWRDGLTLTAAAPFVSTSIRVTEITSIIREATQGMAYLYEYDATTDLLHDLAVFEPNETNPRRRRSRLLNFCLPDDCRDSNGVKRFYLDALVKLEFLPLRNENDFLLLDNWSALKFGMQAIRFENANQDDAAEIKWLKAVRELNFQLRDKLPTQQTPVLVDCVMGGRIGNPI